ncbi:MAG: hypothetical protein OXI81_10605, partial [Paracoccaceae bacterium]|nr:hypothetical protein [Paracoccaceae bacterium]
KYAEIGRFTPRNVKHGLIVCGTAVARYVPERDVGDKDVMISAEDRDKVQGILKRGLPRLADVNRWRTAVPRKLGVFIEAPDLTGSIGCMREAIRRPGWIGSSILKT